VWQRRADTFFDAATVAAVSHLEFDAVPGPQGPDMLRAFRTIRRDAVEFLADCAHRYGPIVSFPIPRVPVVSVSDADAVQRVLQTNHQGYGKRTVQYAALSLVTGEGLLTSDGEVWRSMRRLLQPAFHHQTLGGVLAGVDAAAGQLGDEWGRLPDGVVVDVDAAMMRTTMQVVGSTLFGADLGDQAKRLVTEVAVALNVVVGRAQLPLQPPAWLPTPGNRRLRRSLASLDVAVDRLVGARRQRPDADDVLGLLLRAQHEGLVTPRQVRNEVVTLIVAGHETVATALTWTWYLLSQAPDAAASVRAEGRALPDGPLTLDDVAALPFTRAVLDESLRLYPPAWLISRRALADDALCGYRIPEGTVVIMSPELVHRDARWWPDPDRFDPGRFLGSRRGDLDRRGYLPFGAGPRLCIGRDFALLEATVLLARLAARFTLTPTGARAPYIAPIDAGAPSGGPVGAGAPRVHRGVTGRPAGGLPSHVSPASPPAAP
jgi:cytochrome P450